MSRGLGFVQASILRHLVENGPTTTWWLCVAVYEHEGGDEDKSYHLPAVRRALYGLERQGLVADKGFRYEQPTGAPTIVWAATKAGHRRAQAGLVVNIPRSPTRVLAEAIEEERRARRQGPRTDGRLPLGGSQYAP